MNPFVESSNCVSYIYSLEDVTLIQRQLYASQAAKITQFVGPPHLHDATSAKMHTDTNRALSTAVRSVSDGSCTEVHVAGLYWRHNSHGIVYSIMKVSNEVFCFYKHTMDENCPNFEAFIVGMF